MENIVFLQVRFDDRKKQPGECSIEHVGKIFYTYDEVLLVTETQVLYVRQ